MSADLRRLMELADQRSAAGSGSDVGVSNTKPNRRLQLVLVVVVVVVGVLGWWVMGYRGSGSSAAAESATPAVIVPTPTVFFALPSPTPSPLPLPAVTSAPVVVFRDPPTVVPTPIVQVVERVVYATVVVTQEVILPLVPVPTATMSPGGVRVCVDASGAKEIFINGVGAAGGHCYDYSVGLGASQWSIQVNR